MTNFLHWRKMTWALVLWSGYIAVWTVVTGSGPAIIGLWWLAGIVVLGPLWFATQPLFQQGRGLAAFSSGPAGRTGVSSTSTGATGARRPDAMPVEPERRSSMDPGRGPAADRVASGVTSSAHVPEGLDWQGFSAAYFPGKRRHDLEALTAYGAYRRSRDVGTGSSAEPAGSKRGGAGAGATALRNWEDEGGATLSPDAP